MKISLIGTHGIGKTTAAHEIVAILKKNSFDAGYLEETARQCPLPINENTTTQAQEWIFFQHLIKEIELQNRYSILVCDRSLLDIYAYYLRKFGINEAIEKILADKMKDYDFLFYLPLEKFDRTPQQDKARSTNKEFQIEIDNIVKNLLIKFDIKTIEFEDANKVLDLINTK